MIRLCLRVIDFYSVLSKPDIIIESEVLLCTGLYLRMYTFLNSLLFLNYWTIIEEVFNNDEQHVL